MCAALKAKLEADCAGKVAVETIPVDSSAGPKVYKIELDGEAFFDWVMTPGKEPPVIVAKAPN